MGVNTNTKAISKGRRIIGMDREGKGTIILNQLMTYIYEFENLRILMYF